jgi:hypothetical protein
MHMLILFLLVSAPDQGGRVVLNAGVPEAEFYLDANFVAVTDENGMLTMESFPAGSFSYSVVKRGYKTYKGSFSIRDGEAMQLSPIMERIREAREPDKGAAGSSRGTKPSVKKKQITRNAGSPLEEVRPAQAQNASTNERIADPTAGLAATEESRAPSRLLVIITLFVIAAFGAGIWIWIRKQPDAQIPPLDTVSDIDTSQPPTDAINRPDPEFIEELRRREELMNAGFVGSNPRVIDQESMKEKEVVIVLPKEAFRCEEDK